MGISSKTKTLRRAAHPGRIVIGENMKRVKAAAKEIGAKYYQGWRIDPWNERLAMERNRAWMNRKMKEGYEIIDIGIDPTREVRSRFYEMEKSILTGCAVVPYDKYVQRLRER